MTSQSAPPPTPTPAVLASAAAPLDAAPPSAPSTPRPSSEARLRGVFKGSAAKGLVAISVDGQREAVPIRSDLDADRPVLVASFTKLWVSVSILRHVARKELRLDDEIRALVPELAKKPWADSTLREVMSHTSRVPELENGFFTRTDVDFTHAAATLAKEVPAATERRGVWKYRNSEYAILGAVLEAKSGTSAGDVLRKEIFLPAGMKHAGIAVKGAVKERPPEVDFSPMGRVRPENFFTAGNGYASANDLLAFFEALDRETLLDAESKKLLFDGDPKHDRASLGCWAYPYPTPDGGNTLLVERPGSFGNVKLVTAFAPEKHRAVVFWTGDALDVGKPRTRDSIAFKLAHALLE